MAEVLPRHYVFGIIAFVFLIGAGINMIIDINSGYNTIRDEDITGFQQNFNKYDDVRDSAEDMKSRLRDADTTGPLGVLSGLINSAWNSINLLFTSFDFMTDVYEATATQVGTVEDVETGETKYLIPLWIPTLAAALVTVLFVFAIFTVIFQREI